MNIECKSTKFFVCICLTGLALSNGHWVQAAEKGKPGPAPRCEVDGSLIEAGERAQWVGACADGKPSGRGQIIWTENNRQTRSYDGEVRLGLPEGDGVLKYTNNTRYTGQFTAGKYQGNGIVYLPNGDRYEGQFSAGSVQSPVIYSYANGDRYKGPLSGHLPHGYGSYTLANGDSFEGSFAQGSLPESAIYRFANGTRFEGKLAGGRPSGSGVLYLKEGQRVEGLVTAGEVNGEGRYFYANGNHYEGQMVRSQPQGRGVLYLADGSRIEGDFDADATPKGNVVLQYANKDSYEGGLVKLAPQGKGRLHSNGGFDYVGDFQEGSRTGQALMTYKGGARYQGDFKNGTREGKGEYTWSNGVRYKGEFRGGLPNGLGEMHWPDERKYTGNFVDGLPSGTGVDEKPDGFRFEGSFQQGVWSGAGNLRMPNKSRFIGEFSDGMRQGKGTIITASNEKEDVLFDRDAGKEDKGPHFSLFKSKEDELAGLISDGYYGWALRYYQAYRDRFEGEKSKTLIDKLAAGLAGPGQWRVRFIAGSTAMLLSDGDGGTLISLDRARNFLALGKEEIAQLRKQPLLVRSELVSAAERSLSELAPALSGAYQAQLVSALAAGKLDLALKISASAKSQNIQLVNEATQTAFNDYLVRGPERLGSKSDGLPELLKEGYKPDVVRLQPAFDAKLEQTLADGNLPQALSILQAARSVQIQLMTDDRTNRLAQLVARQIRGTQNPDLLFDFQPSDKDRVLDPSHAELVRAWVDVLASKAEAGKIPEVVKSLRRGRENKVVLSREIAATPMTRAAKLRLKSYDVRGMLALLNELAASGLNLMPEFKKQVTFLRSGNLRGNTPFPVNLKNDTGLSLNNVDDFLDSDQEAMELLSGYEFVVLLDMHPRYTERRLGQRKQVKSSFSEGMEEVPNPEYQKLQAELANAQAVWAQANQQAAGGGGSSSSMPNMGGNQKLTNALSLLSVLGSSGGGNSQAQADAAAALGRMQGLQSQLGEVPRTLRQPLKVDYRYEELDIEILRNLPVTAYVINLAQNNYARASLLLQRKDTVASTLGIHSKDKYAKRSERLDRIRQIERSALDPSLLDILSAESTDGATEGKPSSDGKTTPEAPEAVDSIGLRQLERLSTELGDKREEREQSVTQLVEASSQKFDKAVQVLLRGLHEDARARDEQVVEMLNQTPEVPQRNSRDARKLAGMLAKLSLNTRDKAAPAGAGDAARAGTN